MAMQSSYNMHRSLSYIFCVILISLNGCLDAPHDNVYDPKNPNKAYLLLNVNELGLYDLQGAIVSLLVEDSIAQSDTSDELGVVAFEKVDPGVYYLLTEATYYSALEQGPESLWAGAEVNRKIELVTLDFEDDYAGISSPYRFNAMNGTWTIIADTEQPEAHSAPQVYQGSDINPEEIALSLCDTEALHFLFQIRMKVEITSNENWQAGVVFRYQDEDNCYRLLLSTDTIRCYALINGQHTELRQVVKESNTGEWHTIRVERRDGESYIRIIIDNAVLFSLFDNVFSGGRIGLIVSNGDFFEPTTVNFDDVTIDLTHTHLQ